MIDLIDVECDEIPTEEFDDLDGTSFDAIGTLQVDALEYISGYIIRKLKLEGYECHESSNTWVDQISKGNLIKPSAEFVDAIKKLEGIFHK